MKSLKESNDIQTKVFGDWAVAFWKKSSKTLHIAQNKGDLGTTNYWMVGTTTRKFDYESGWLPNEEWKTAIKGHFSKDQAVQIAKENAGKELKENMAGRKTRLKEATGGDGGLPELKSLENALEKEDFLCTWTEEDMGSYVNKKLIVNTDLGMFDIDYVPGEWLYIVHFSGPGREFTKYREYVDDVVEIVVNVIEDQLDDWGTDMFPMEEKQKRPAKKNLKESWDLTEKEIADYNECFTQKSLDLFLDDVATEYGDASKESAKKFVNDHEYDYFFDHGKYAIAVGEAFSRMIVDTFKKNGLEASHSEDYIGRAAYCSVLKSMFNVIFGPGTWTCFKPKNPIMLKLPNLDKGIIDAINADIADKLEPYADLLKIEPKFIRLFQHYETTQSNWVRSVKSIDDIYELMITGNWDSTAFELNYIGDVETYRPVIETLAKTIAEDFEYYSSSEGLEESMQKRKSIKESWKGADINYEWELRETFQDIIEHAYFQSQGKLSKEVIENAFKEAMDDILEKDPTHFHFYDEDILKEQGWVFVFGKDDYSVFERNGKYLVTYDDGTKVMESIPCRTEAEARAIIEELEADDE